MAGCGVQGVSARLARCGSKVGSAGSAALYGAAQHVQCPRQRLEEFKQHQKDSGAQAYARSFTNMRRSRACGEYSSVHAPARMHVYTHILTYAHKHTRAWQHTYTHSNTRARNTHKCAHMQHAHWDMRVGLVGCRHVEELDTRVKFTEEKLRENRNRLDQIDDKLKEAGAQDKERRDAQVSACVQRPKKQPRTARSAGTRR